MNGILVVDKPKDYTSRDIVNIVSKALQIKKVGHTGTLDPLATGTLVLCIGKATKFVEIITAYEKEYIAQVVLGMETDSYDVTGNIIREEEVHASKEEIEKVLHSFMKTYNQEVPIYSAVKVQGKKLYEYARKGETVELPKKEITIHHIELLGAPTYQDGKTIFTMKCTVSKGTYIRSLISDIAKALHTIGVMKELRRTKQGDYAIEEAISIDDIQVGNYQIISLDKILERFSHVKANHFLEERIKNGALLPNKYGEGPVLFVNQKEEPLALYQVYEKDKTQIKPWKMIQERNDKQ